MEQSGQVGTPLYLSPEQLALGKDQNAIIEIDEKVDIYSLGLILLELSCNITTTHEKISTFTMIKEKREFPAWTKIKGSPEGNIIVQLTEPNPRKRPSALEIRSQWLKLWEKELLDP